MLKALGVGKTFLFLQGPHGPFFDALGSMLRSAGAQVWRVGFNRGDEAFWSDGRTYIPFVGHQSEWRRDISSILTDKGVTDIVLYGDTRFVHAEAIRVARDMQLRIHVFEEGYLRPYWCTYERDGSNGNSKLMDKSVQQMRVELEGLDLDLPDAPARWGDMRQHMFYGAIYHAFVLLWNRRYRNFRPHRALSVRGEFKLYVKRLFSTPARAGLRFALTRRIKRGGYPFHLALLQLEHDSSFIEHSPFASMEEFLSIVIEGFAKGAPPHHRLIFKGHPLEDGRTPLRQQIADLSRRFGVEGRVHYVPGGKLATLLNHARTAVTVNSTAAQQALWRGLPLKAFGAAVYDKPEFVSEQPLAEFFANPARPDSRAYRDYRHYLLETSQITGGYYSQRARQQLLRQVADMILAKDDPYDALSNGNAAPRQQLRLVN
ncbi:capsule biosynthesis protein [Brevirhabdus sp.]|uniref:capsule biosynthesis protein n=1 Tax=Brevirhabdus sp. TaxID=2004514 RepID=UPI004058BD79